MPFDGSALRAVQRGKEVAARRRVFSMPRTIVCVSRGIARTGTTTDSRHRVLLQLGVDAADRRLLRLRVDGPGEETTVRKAAARWVHTTESRLVWWSPSGGRTWVRELLRMEW